MPPLYKPCPCCGGALPTAEDDDIDSMDSIVERIARAMRRGDSPTGDPELLAGTVTQIAEKMAQGYGRELDAVAWDSPDAAMIENLTRNVYHFSAAKNYQELRDMTLALHDGERLLSESEYLARVQAINGKYNGAWLRTERNAAIAGGQMASRWAQYASEADIMPMLVYRTVGDRRVRADHAALDGTTKHIEDPFWSTYYPPNGWGCRCDVEQHPASNAIPTPARRTPQVFVDPLFRTNLGRQGLIFPKGHPYYNGVPKGEIRKSIAYLPPENSYMTVQMESGKTAELHVMHGAEEGKKNLLVVADLYRAGYTNARLLPDIYVKDAALRKKFLPEGYKQPNPAKNPDLVIRDAGGRDWVCDIKVLEGERNFAMRISKAAEQAEIAIVKLSTPRANTLSISNIKKMIAEKLEAHESLRGVIVLDKEGEVIERVLKTTAGN